MVVPDFQSLMLPVLKRAAGGEVRIGDAVEKLADELGLSVEDRAELLPSGRQSTFANRVHWARTYLKQAGLIEATRRAHFRISDRGKSVLADPPPRFDINFLSSFPEFLAFRERVARPSVPSTTIVMPFDEAPHAGTPDDVIQGAYEQLNVALGEDMLDRILQAPPAFFERLIVSLLLAMGYGGTASDAGRAIGRSGDNGVDGVVDQDPLGLDRVYIQAKRYQQHVSVDPAAVRDFFGSLDMHKATKGLFVTTSSFSKAAKDTAERLGKRIVLIDGTMLTQLMIRYDVGCRVERQLTIRRLDEEFFE